MAALLLRRASSFLIPLATSSPKSLHNRLFASRFLPLCTATSGPETSDKTHPLAFGTPDKFSALDGMPFDSAEMDPEGKFGILRRKTEDEIIEIIGRAATDYTYGDSLPPLYLAFKILYGNDFNRCFMALCECFPDNRLAIREISVRSLEKSGGRVHLEEFEDFFKQRGIEPRNFNFLIDYFAKSDGIKKD